MGLLDDEGTDEGGGAVAAHGGEVGGGDRPGGEGVAEDRGEDGAPSLSREDGADLAARAGEGGGHGAGANGATAALEELEEGEGTAVDEVAEGAHAGAGLGTVNAGADAEVVRLEDDGAAVDRAEAEVDGRGPGSLRVAPLGAGVEEEVDALLGGEQAAVPDLLDRFRIPVVEGGAAPFEFRDARAVPAAVRAAGVFHARHDRLDRGHPYSAKTCGTKKLGSAPV